MDEELVLPKLHRVIFDASAVWYSSKLQVLSDAVDDGPSSGMDTYRNGRYNGLKSGTYGLATGSFACRSSVQYEIRILLIFFVRMNE
jgi:hypothetical protein